MSIDIDGDLGRRLRRRRKLLGMTQSQLATLVGIRFQQIQKYECGANKMSAARIWQLSIALDVPASYFFDGISKIAAPKSPIEESEMDRWLGLRETKDLVQALAQLPESPRRKFLSFAKDFKS